MAAGIFTHGGPQVFYDVHGSFAFLDDSGTATLRSRPGHRVRPMLQFSTSNTDAQGLAVPTPSVPLGFTDNASIGNGPKLNGNYRMCSSAGDLHLVNYYNDDFEEIPAPPSMPPPPPPNMAPPPPPKKSPPSSAISSPSSPSPPDFIPPIPNSSAPRPPSFLVNQFAGPTAEQQQTNVAKWKSEIALNAVSKDSPMTLPNRLSLNPAAFQYTQGQANFDMEPRSTLPKSFKIPPPAPTRTSSIQPQEPLNIGYKDPPQSPVPSSFNPTFQAKLFAARQGEQSLDTLNKRKSVLIMEDLPDFMENSDQRIEKSANVTDSVGSKAVSSLKDSTNVQNPKVELKKQIPQVELKKQIKTEDAVNNKMEPASIFQENQPYELTSVPVKHEEEQKDSQNGTERNTLTRKHGFIQEVHPTSKPTVKIISLKPIISELSLLNPNGSKQDSIPRKETDILSQELTKMDNEVKPKPEKSLENVKECPPSPPLMAPPPPPTLIVLPNQQSITPLPLPVQNGAPQKTSSVINSTAQPPAPLFNPATVTLMTSPALSPKPKTITVTPKPQALVPPPPKAPPAPPPPIAPPAPPPLPSTVGPSSSVPLLEALQAKQQTLRNIPKSIEVRPAQKSAISGIGDEQKIRVGKIKSELEALFSPKKDEGGEKLKKPCPDPEVNKNSNGNLSHSKGGENKLVNSLMLKVPLLPAKFDKDDDDVDSDNSEWMPKSNNMDIPLPEPDYLPKSPILKTEKSTYSEVQNKIPKATLEISVPPSPLASSQDTDTADVMESSIPTYKPHRKTKVSTESSIFDELPVVTSKPEADVGMNLYSIPQRTETATSELSMKEEPLASQAKSSIKFSTTGEKVEANSPMALLMAAQKRAQKAKSLERPNLPKISVTNGVVTSSSASPYTERKVNTFVVVPNKDNVGQFTEEVTSFTSNSSHGSDSTSIPSAWRDAEPQYSGIRRTFDRNFENSVDQSSTPYVYNSPAVLESTTDRHEEYLEPKTIVNDHISTTVPNSTESSTFNLSSFPSPFPKSKMMSYEMEYGIIPPPEEFMNSPVGSNSNLNSIPQEDRSYNFDYNASHQFDVIPNYNRNNSVIQPFASLSTSSNSGFSNYNDNYSMAAQDSQRGSLIKKRLYMPEPESSRNYGLNTSSMRSSTMPLSYSSMHAQSSLNMVPDSWRSNTMSRFIPQGRRVSSENASRMVPSMMDMKYRSQNSDFSLETSSARSQSKHQQGMTFTVRPGTRQPISQTYQGGYL
ncbi:hypothetical protein GDO78_008540 [Eleutherodactylus coqui]|uniref:Uncharacterized protein n=1 Tax=Eleutherodactylus coqui TaxID=57060 RepID=A0A8J6FDB3_ELECQ|nr:hypothetical protein GDO78_008540 [Eleutherodactylus coqui]